MYGRACPNSMTLLALLHTLLPKVASTLHLLQANTPQLRHHPPFLQLLQATTSQLPPPPTFPEALLAQQRVVQAHHLRALLVHSHLEGQQGGRGGGGRRCEQLGGRWWQGVLCCCSTPLVHALIAAAAGANKDKGHVKVPQTYAAARARSCAPPSAQAPTYPHKPHTPPTHTPTFTHPHTFTFLSPLPPTPPTPAPTV